MFEQALFEQVRDNFTVSGYALEFGFGVIPESAEAPYVTMFVLDSNGDQQVLCDGQFDSGNVFVQFNVYHPDTTNAFYIKRQLDLYLAGLRGLTLGGQTYKINEVQHEPSPSGNIIDNGLAVDVLAKTIKYNEV